LVWLWYWRWGFGGAALDFSADADDVPNAAPEPSHHLLNAANLSKDHIRWAQIDAFTTEGFANETDWSIPAILWRFERCMVWDTANFASLSVSVELLSNIPHWQIRIGSPL